MPENATPAPPVDRRYALIGGLLIIIAAIGFSSKSILIKMAYAEDSRIDAITLLTLRMMLALPFFLVIAYLNQRKKRISEYPPRDLLALLALALTGYYLASLLDFIGLETVPAGQERLILFLYPTMVLLIMAAAGRKRIGARQVIALAGSYLGIALVFTGQQSINGQIPTMGALLIFASAFAYACYLVGSGELLKRLGSGFFTAISMSIACIATMTHFFVRHDIAQLQVAPDVLPIALTLAVFSTVIPAFLMNAGIRRIGAANASIISMIGPVITLLLAYYFLDESFGPMETVGAILVIGGVFLVSRRTAAEKDDY